MKKLTCIILLISMILMLTACGGGNTENVEIQEWEQSEIYSDSDINAAVETVKEYFNQESFDGCTLTKIGYAGDHDSTHIYTIDRYPEEEYKEGRNDYAEEYGTDEAIVLYSSFYTDSTVGDTGFETNHTYDNCRWVLVRNKGEAWRHAGHGAI